MYVCWVFSLSFESSFEKFELDSTHYSREFKSTWIQIECWLNFFVKVSQMAWIICSPKWEDLYKIERVLILT